MPDLSVVGRTTACVVCTQPLRAPGAPPRQLRAAPADGLCGDPHCQALFDQVRDLPAAHRERHFAFYANVRRRQRERAASRRARAELERRQEEDVFAHLQAKARGGPASDLELVTPSGRGASRPLPHRRRRAHAAHLAAIIAAAFGPEKAPSSADPKASSDPDPSPGDALAGRLCGVCGGGCCVAGGEKAYLSEATIRRVRAANPELGPAEIHAAYLGRVAARTRAGSCVHHTRGGCSLPRALRSDVCNDFMCSSLARLQSLTAGERPVRTATVLRRRRSLWEQGEALPDNDLIAAAVISDAATRTLRLKAGGGPCGERRADGLQPGCGHPSRSSAGRPKPPTEPAAASSRR